MTAWHWHLLALREAGMPPRKSSVVRAPRSQSLSIDESRLLIDSVIDYAIFVLDVEGRVATWNAGGAAIKGYKASEIIGQHFSKFYSAEDVAAGKPQRELEIATKVGRVEDEGWRIRKDGTRFWANVVITALRDEAGVLRGFGKVTRDLTARRATEERLRQAEQRFHHLIDAVVDYAIFMLDPAGNVTTWNAGARRVKGFTFDEVLGKHFSIFYTAEDRAAGKPEAILKAVQRDGRYEDESWRVRKDGTRFWANVVLTALRDEQGTLVGFAKVTRDLTGRREAEENERRLLLERASREVAQQAERGRRESEERYRSLSQRLEIVLEGVADGITAQDRSGRVVFANTAAARLCGLDSAEQLMQLPSAETLARFEVLDVDGQPFEPGALPARRVLAGDPANSAVLHLRERRTRQDFWVSLQASAVRNAEGAPELAINIWHDVTAERRQHRQASALADATAALASSLVSVEMLSTLAPLLVPSLADWCAIDLLEGGQLRSVSVAHVDPAKISMARRMRTKYPPDPARASGAWNVIRSGTAEVFDEIPDALLVSAARDAEHLAGLRALAMKAALVAPIRARGRVLGTITLVVAESDRRFDASDVALAEELGRRTGVALENAELYAAAQDAAKRAEEASQAKDVFLATVSHELRTPLAAILGWSTLLKDRITDPETLKPITVIHRNAQAQVRIIDDILDVSRVITGKFQLDAKPADLVSIARDALEVVRPSADAKQITLELGPGIPFCPLVADPERMQQVIWNVLSNAVKFTQPGGSVRVSIDRAGSNVELAVTDSGKGIDPDFLPFVFDRFRQADSSTTRRVGGLCLGLALVRHIVELHGGRVAAASEGVDRGTTITISLPVRALINTKPEAPSPSQQRSSGSTLVVDLSGVRVLVVDDEPDARDVVAAVLIGAGAKVETAPSAADGFSAFQRFRPDVLVSDIGMPGEDGFSFIRRIRALSTPEGGRIPSLALTAFAREEDRTRALSAGYTTHIGKPANPDALVSAVANLSGVRARS